MKSLDEWLSSEGCRASQIHSLSGGCIADSRQVVLDDGRQIFVKQMPHAVAGMFLAEAAGLEALAKHSPLKVPEVVFQSEHLLILEFIEASNRQTRFEEVLGHGLAELHGKSAEGFGYPMDTFCGSTKQPNNLMLDGYQFYAENRFLYLAKKCLSKGLLTKDDVKQVEMLCSNLPSLIPEQKPALLHGDLWSGNVHVSEQGLPVLIDPAVYWGWPEADLAMTQLFGGFSGRFYDAYQEARPLPGGWRERMDLYNLWHLLNHLLLFGSGYLADVKRVICRYT